MSEFDPSQPAILHDRRSDSIVTWTGEHAGGVVEWNGMLF